MTRLLALCKKKGLDYERLCSLIEETRGILHIENYVTQQWLWDSPEKHPIRLYIRAIESARHDLAEIQGFDAQDIETFADVDRTCAMVLGYQLVPGLVFETVLEESGLLRQQDR